MYKRKFNVQKNIRYTDERSMMYKGILKIRREAALKYKQLLLCNKMTEIKCIWYRNGD